MAVMVGRERSGLVGWYTFHGLLGRHVITPVRAGDVVDLAHQLGVGDQPAVGDARSPVVATVVARDIAADAVGHAPERTLGAGVLPVLERAAVGALPLTRKW